MHFSNIVKIITDFTLSMVDSYGLLAIFFLMALESASIPFPSFVTMPFAGFLVSGGYWSMALIIIVGTLGNIFGSLAAYWLGFSKGEKWVRIFIRKVGKYFLLTEEKFETGIDLFNKYGNKIVFFSRMIPVVRAFTSIPAGVAKVEKKSFLLLTSIGSLIWVIFLAYTGYILGENWSVLGPIFKKLQFIILGVILLLISLYIYKSLKKKKN